MNFAKERTIEQIRELKHLDQFNYDPQEIVSQTLFHSKAFAYTAQIERNGIPVDANLYN